MNDVVFVTDANKKFWKMAEELKKSIKFFYPQFDVFIHPYTDSECIANQEDDYKFENDPGRSYNFLLPYFNKYKRVVHLNSDMLMVSECPELFEDFEFGMTRNNINLNSGSNPDQPFMQNGLMVVTNPEVFKEMTRLNKETRPNSSSYYDMYSANQIFYSGKYKTKTFSFPDKIYGVEEIDNYGICMVSKQNPKDINCWNKKACIFHFSGPLWKNYQTGKINYDHFGNNEVRTRIEEILK
jgi:hypothetical protein